MAGFGKVSVVRDYSPVDMIDRAHHWAEGQPVEAIRARRVRCEAVAMRVHTCEAGHRVSAYAAALRACGG